MSALRALIGVSLGIVAMCVVFVVILVVAAFMGVAQKRDR